MKAVLTILPALVRLDNTLIAAMEHVGDADTLAKLRHERDEVRWASYRPGPRVAMEQLLEEQTGLIAYRDSLQAKADAGDAVAADELVEAKERLAAVEVEIKARPVRAARIT